jgi:uncharacterized protein
MSGVAPIPVGIDAAATTSPSNSFTMTKGWRGEYRVTEPLVKQFASYVP